MATLNASALNFADVVQKCLNEYGDECTEALTEVVPKAAKNAAKRLKQASPKKTGKYAKGWAKKQQYYRGLGTSYVVYNRDRYRVAHLLERSHRIKNQWNTYGSTVGDNVIRDATDYTEQWLVTETEKRLKG